MGTGSGRRGVSGRFDVLLGLFAFHFLVGSRAPGWIQPIRRASEPSAAAALTRRASIFLQSGPGLFEVSHIKESENPQICYFNCSFTFSTIIGWQTPSPRERPRGTDVCARTCLCG